MLTKFKKGFSLVELLVVIAIIGILAAVGITAYSGYTSSAKVKATLANASQVVKFINSEMAKCAGGDGNFAWGNPDPCTRATPGGSSAAPNAEAYVATQVNPGAIANHINIALGMRNPYDVTQVAANITGNTEGEMVIDCNTTQCTVVTTHGDATEAAVVIPYM